MDDKPLSFEARETVSVSPDMRTVLVPIKGTESGQGEQAATEAQGDEPVLQNYALYSVDDNSLQPLSAPLRNGETVEWSEEGDMFAAVGDDVIVVYTAKGSELINEPLEGREILGLHFYDGLLLAVCSEETQTTLVSYDLDGGGARRTVLVEHASSKSSSTIGVRSGIQWMPTQQRDFDRDPGDLGVWLPSEWRLFLVDCETLAIAQELDECLGYDQNTDSFVVLRIESDASFSVGAYHRYTTDNLVECGTDQLKDNTMTDAQRSEYGLPPIA